MLDAYFITLALAIAISAGTTMLGIAITHRRDLGDWLRRTPTERPRWGGAVVFLTFALVPFLASMVSAHAAGIFAPKSGDFLMFLGACALVFAVGFVDDWKVLNWKPKLVAQVVAALAVYSAGYSMERVGLPWGPDISLGLAAPLVTVLWIVFFTNAINLIDGRDGVAPGVAILAAATLAQVASNSGHPSIALLLAAAAGATLGMLVFNLPPATVYIGDSGALLLGFILGSLSVRASTGVTDAVFIGVPLIALGFPLLDSVLAVARRALDHRHPLMGDRDHIHHRLEAAGLGPRGLVLVIYMICGLFSAGAMLLHYVHHFGAEIAVLAGTMLVIAIILSRLGYVISLWNSATIVWIRRRFQLAEEPAPSDPGS